MRLIDADKLEAEVMELFVETRRDSDFEIGLKAGIGSVISRIAEAETLKPKQGKWLEHEIHPIGDCSICGERVPIYAGSKKYRYCPNCGAEMELSNGE